MERLGATSEVVAWAADWAKIIDEAIIAAMLASIRKMTKLKVVDLGMAISSEDLVRTDSQPESSFRV